MPSIDNSAGRLIESFRYRPEVDGLRAVAVLAVVLFHAGLGVPGGYVGVDVFFVISGFLITSLIIKDLEAGKFTLAQFWERRARRILPAIGVVVLATLVAGWFLLLPSDYSNLGRSAAWQAVFGANFHYWLSTGYFAGAAEEMPLLHTWSLAVEEQFYMVVPLLLLGVFRLPRFRSRRILLSLFAAGIAVSLVASIYGVARHPAAAFYLLPTRAWELLCGAFIALVPVKWIPCSRISREGFSLLGLVGILLPCWLYTKATPFPGFAALSPCLGAGLFILASTDSGTSHQLPASARLLASRPIVFIGLISYSLYLWHWPFFAFSTYWALEPLSLGFRLALVAASFGLAILSWRFVELPFRKRQFCAKRSAMFTFGSAGTAVTLAFGYLVLWQRGFPSRLPAKALEYANAKDDNEGIHALTAEDVRAGRLVPIGNPDPKSPVTLLLWGDSHAMAVAPAFDQLLKEKGVVGRQATASVTAPVLDAYWTHQFTQPKEIQAFNAAVFGYIKQHRVPIVVLVGRWDYYIDDKGSEPLDTALLFTIQRLVEIGTRPYLLLQVPHQRIIVPKALARASVFDSDLTPWLVKPTAWNGLRGNDILLLQKMEAAGCRILDPRPRFLDGAGRHFIAEKDGISLYRDAHHLSATGAKMIILPFLREVLNLPEMPR